MLVLPGGSATSELLPPSGLDTCQDLLVDLVVFLLSAEHWEDKPTGATLQCSVHLDLHQPLLLGL